MARSHGAKDLKGWRVVKKNKIRMKRERENGIDRVKEKVKKKVKIKATRIWQAKRNNAEWINSASGESNFVLSPIFNIRLCSVVVVTREYIQGFYYSNYYSPFVLDGRNLFLELKFFNIIITNFICKYIFLLKKRILIRYVRWPTGPKY